MATTRRLEFFQDPSCAAGTAGTPQYTSNGFPEPIRYDKILQSGRALNKQVILNPPASGSSGRSPLKAVCQSNTSPSEALLRHRMNVDLPPPQTLTFPTDSPTKKFMPSTLHSVALQSSLNPIFATFSRSRFIDKESNNPTCPSDNFAEFPDPSRGSNASLKRTQSSFAPISGRQSKKARLEDPPSSEIPEPQNMPLVEDTGKKPNYSYASLIGMSILRAPGRRLTLAHIYKWISDSFSYYRKTDTGWQNSIRHNLSINKAFFKQERPKDDPGKGNYWAIKPGMEPLFVKDKASRRPTSSSSLNFKSSSQLPSDSIAWPVQLQAPQKGIPHVSEICEPSSDATIPASDAPSQEDHFEEAVRVPSPVVMQHSSPLQQICSSPPVARHPEVQDGMPSPFAELPVPSSNLISQNRNIVSIDDSGYFSSLDSSATRPFLNPPLPDLNAERPRMKRGRAEEEIARIRSSSHDLSPSNGRSLLKQPTFSLASSSPLRHFDNSLMLPPLTPAVKFKLPPKPPASISPNTNLRNHRNKIRELVGSPVKSTSSLNDDISFSPAFKIVDDEHHLLNDDFNMSFNIFMDNNENEHRPPLSASPGKRSVRCARVDRANKNVNILADITGYSLNSKVPLSALKARTLDSPLGTKSSQSPLAFGSASSIVTQDDLFSFDLDDDDELDDFGGLDILQGFQKIGGSRNSITSVRKLPRPGLGTRSHTSRF